MRQFSEQLREAASELRSLREAESAARAEATRCAEQLEQVRWRSEQDAKEAAAELARARRERHSGKAELEERVAELVAELTNARRRAASAEAQALEAKNGSEEVHIDAEHSRRRALIAEERERESQALLRARLETAQGECIALRHEAGLLGASAEEAGTARDAARAEAAELRELNAALKRRLAHAPDLDASHCSAKLGCSPHRSPRSPY